MINIKKIKCKFGFHKYYVIKELASWSRKIGCKSCDKCFGMNDNVRVVIPWDRALEELYKTIECYYDNQRKTGNAIDIDIKELCGRIAEN